MLYRMVRPVQRKGTRNRQFVQRIPSDLRSKVGGLRLDIPLGDSVTTLTLSSKADSVRFSLRTDAPEEVKQRQAAAAAYLTQVWKSLRSDATSLTHRQATALAGELFRSWADDRASRSMAIERTPEGVWKRVDDEVDEERIAEWSAVIAQWDTALENGDAAKLESALGPIADRLMMRKGVGQLDRQSRMMLLESLGKALRDAFEVRQRQASGDYSTDLVASRFPAWSADVPPPSGRTGLGRQSVSLGNLVTEWWREAQLAGLKTSTHESYRNTMAKFVAFLGHDDASGVTKDDVLRFKQHRLSSGVSPKTVKDSDLAGLKTLFGWAVSNNKLPENPAAGATLKIGRQRKLRSKAFSDSEARAILRHARDYRPTRESRKLTAVKRWVPWLCAFTGARVGEMLQLRKEDVRYEGDMCVVLITPEAGTVKSNEAREIVLHPQIIEEGFYKFVESSEAGHLFIAPRPRDGDLLAPIKTARNKLGAFVREVVPDPNVDPNHAWRHRFKTIGREVAVADTILDALQGHRPKSVGDSYGDVTITARANAINKFPRYDF